MPVSGKYNISRTLWRFLEIILFFLVSVLGYSFLAKTSSFNAKSKSKEHSLRVVISQSFSDKDVSSLYSYQTSPPAVYAFIHSPPPFYAVFQRTTEKLPRRIRTVPVPTYKVPAFPKTNLFQQNQVFII
jgi:hypothetical protein